MEKSKEKLYIIIKKSIWRKEATWIDTVGVWRFNGSYDCDPLHNNVAVNIISIDNFRSCMNNSEKIINYNKRIMTSKLEIENSTYCKQDECSKLGRWGGWDWKSGYCLRTWVRLGKGGCILASHRGISATTYFPVHLSFRFLLNFNIHPNYKSFIHTYIHTSSVSVLLDIIINIPVITTSVRFVPKMRLVYLPPAASRPRPYDGKGLITGHSFIS